MDYTQFQENLKALIESRGITYKALAQEIGFSPVTISRYLAQKRDPDLEHVIRLAKYFGVSVDWLLGLGSERYEVIPLEERNLLQLYRIASPDDRYAVDAILKKYRGE